MPGCLNLSSRQMSPELPTMCTFHLLMGKSLNIPSELVLCSCRRQGEFSLQVPLPLSERERGRGGRERERASERERERAQRIIKAKDCPSLVTGDTKSQIQEAQRTRPKNHA